ncbi:hypothetical protein BWK69_00250 [Candidatus Parcubacteria bacterium A4]|nr:MAG: hypothetical protein BWK69_00250 [Candidatus Parcubacteria bacterium A4]
MPEEQKKTEGVKKKTTEEREMPEELKEEITGSEELSDQKIQDIIKKANRTVEEAKINPTDPDFTLMFAVAITTDICTLFPIIGSLVSLIVGIFIMVWMYGRHKKITDAKEEAEKILKELESGGSKSKKALRGLRYAKMRQKSLTKFLIKRGCVYIASLVPILNMIPFWTILLILTIREE